MGSFQTSNKKTATMQFLCWSHSARILNITPGGRPFHALVKSGRVLFSSVSVTTGSPNFA